MVSRWENVVVASAESSVNDVEIFSQVLGPRSGYLMCLASCVKPTSISSSS